MEDIASQLNFFDLGVIGTIFVVGIFGIWLGFVSGSLYVLSWFGAGIAAFYGYPLTKPYAHDYIESEWIADAAAIFSAFLAALIVLVLIAAMIGAWIRRTQLNALDRSLGFFAGLVMGAFLICVGYVSFAYYVPVKDHPKWLIDAKLTPIIAEVSVEIVKAVPDEWLRVGGQMITRADRPSEEGNPDIIEDIGAAQMLQDLLHPRAAPEEPAPVEGGQPAESQPGQQGYDNQDRNEMNRAVEGTTNN